MAARYLGEEAGTGSGRRAQISPSKKRKRERCVGPENGTGATADGAGSVETDNHGGEGRRRRGGSNRRLAGVAHTARGGDGEGSDNTRLCEKDREDARRGARQVARAQAPSIGERRAERFFCYHSHPLSAPRVIQRLLLFSLTWTAPSASVLHCFNI
jgi:hypothetical protein